MVRTLPSPSRARSLDAAMEEASSPLIVHKTLSFMSSDEEDNASEEETQENNTHERSGTSSEATSDPSPRMAASRGTFRYRTRRIERLDVYGKKDLPYRRHALQSPLGRRSTSEQGTPTSHTRHQPVKSKSVSPPCSSPATLLSCNLGSKLSMASPMVIPLRPQVTMLLNRLNVADGLNHFVTSFEDVQTIRWLGAGVSAEVFKVRDPKTGEFYAIKKSKQELRNKQERYLLTQEIVALEKLHTSRHNFDHIVRYFQAWQENGFFFLQMELCDGGTLQEFTTKHNREAILEECLWDIIRDVATGLKVLHEHDIVHLDIKPDNIFITEDGKLKIGDFGMAGKVVASTNSLSRIGDLEGDAKYIAKELLSSAARLPSADIFCLGIMMLEIATGVALPESGQQWHDLREGELPSFPVSCTEGLSKMIRQMMHPDAAKRPSAADILKNASLQTDNGPATLILEHALRQKLVMPTTLRNTNRSAKTSLQTPRKTRLSVP